MVMTTTTTTKAETTTTEVAATRKPLIAGVLRRPVAAATQRRAFTAEECSEVRRAAREGRDVRDRTVDHVVDRLLNELTW